MPGRCLRQSWGGGVPHAAYASCWLPLSFDYWCYLGSCMGAFRCLDPSSSPASSNLFSSSGEERAEKRSLLSAHISLLMFIICTCLGERDMKCLSLVFQWRKQEWAVHPSFSLWKIMPTALRCPSHMRLLSCLVRKLPPALFASSCSCQRKEEWMLRRVVCSSCLLLPFLLSRPSGGWPGRGFPSVFSASETALTTVNQRCS